VLLKDPSFNHPEESATSDNGGTTTAVRTLLTQLRVSLRLALQEYGNSVFVCLD
jgi:hypothetical protein